MARPPPGTVQTEWKGREYAESSTAGRRSGLSWIHGEARSSTLLLEHRLEGTPDGLFDQLGAGRVRMDAVRVVESWHPSDALQKERRESDAMLIGEVAECLAEL